MKLSNQEFQIINCALAVCLETNDRDSVIACFGHKPRYSSAEVEALILKIDAYLDRQEGKDNVSK